MHATLQTLLQTAVALTSPISLLSSGLPFSTIPLQVMPRDHHNHKFHNLFLNASIGSPAMLICKHPNFQKVDNCFIIRDPTVNPPISLSISSADIEHSVRINTLTCTDAQRAL